MRLPRVWMALATVASVASGQDTQSLGAVVIVAERSATPLNRSAAAVTRLTRADLARLPNATLADVLGRVPGFAIVNFDGLGRDPQAMVRGFYGGGEADYVVVMVDGRAVSRGHNGTVPWDELPPLPAIESIEIVRGSASTMHGDAAVAGVINIVTRGSPVTPPQWRMAVESHSGLAASVDVGDSVFSRPFEGTAMFDRTSGFREHSARTAAGARGSMRLSPLWHGSARYSWHDFDDPGPLLESLLQDGTEIDPRFARDGGSEGEWGATFDLAGVLGSGGSVRTAVRIAGRNAQVLRTLPLTPDFGDSKERELNTLDAGATTQADLDSNILPWGERLSVGLSADYGTIDSRYYTPADDEPRQLVASGDGHRATLSAFAHLATSSLERTRWTFGLRADFLSDAFTPDGGVDVDATHFALSPKVGVNFRYASGGRASGYTWASVSRTFKAPTLDQLFDQRPIPIPFPPFSLTTSNPGLNPQRGTSLESGIYHDVAMSAGHLSLTLTLYQIAMQDELDLDLQTFQYVNIAESRHRGVEAGVSFTRGPALAWASMTLQDAVARAGDNSGNRLKAIPGQMLSTGLTLSPANIGTLSISLTRTADMFIDDANSGRIPSWTRVDAQASRRFGPVEGVVGIRNLLDERYNSTGFLDPSGSGQAYYYPAAGRVLTLGVRNAR